MHHLVHDQEALATQPQWFEIHNLHGKLRVHQGEHSEWIDSVDQRKAQGCFCIQVWWRCEVHRHGSRAQLDANGGPGEEPRRHNGEQAEGKLRN